MEVRGAGKVVPAPRSRQVCLLAVRVRHQVLARRNDAVDEPVRLRLLGAHEAVAVHVALDRLDRLPGVLGVERVHLAAQIEDLARLDLDVRRRALRAARRLVDHDPRVRQRASACPCVPRGEQERIPCDAAMPMQIVFTGACRCCIVS